MSRADHLGLDNLCMNELIPGRDCFLPFSDYWLPLALHLGVDNMDFALCVLAYQLVLSPCWSCSCKHNVENS